MTTNVPAPARPAWLSAAEFPFTSRQLTIDSHPIHYLDEGNGPTMAFVHAGPAWSFVYRDLIVRLRHQFRCVALDLPGTGLSPAAGGYQPSIQAGAAIFGAFARALDLRQVTLVTHDVGTPVALGAAIRMPERVAALSVTEGFAWALADENPRIARTLRIVGSRPVGVLNDAVNFLARVTASRAGAGRHLRRQARVPGSLSGAGGAPQRGGDAARRRHRIGVPAADGRGAAGRPQRPSGPFGVRQRQPDRQAALPGAVEKELPRRRAAAGGRRSPFPDERRPGPRRWRHQQLVDVSRRLPKRLLITALSSPVR
jgi:pimeloyl-ACP methyl ester carboxylesterase